MTLVQLRSRQTALEQTALEPVARRAVITAWTGGPGDIAAARWALHWARQTGRELTVLVAGAALTPGRGYRSEIAAAFGVPVAMTESPFLRVIERPGDVATALLAETAWDDVLVVPTDGPAPIPNRPLGRSVEQVVSRHPGAVVVVPALFRQDPDGTVVVGHDVTSDILGEIGHRAPVVQVTGSAAMVDASQAASLVVVRCRGHASAVRPTSCRALQVARSSWCPVVAVHAPGSTPALSGPPGPSRHGSMRPVRIA